MEWPLRPDTSGARDCAAVAGMVTARRAVASGTSQSPPSGQRIEYRGDNELAASGDDVEVGGPVQVGDADVASSGSVTATRAGVVALVTVPAAAIGLAVVSLPDLIEQGFLIP